MSMGTVSSMNNYITASTQSTSKQSSAQINMERLTTDNGTEADDGRSISSLSLHWQDEFVRHVPTSPRGSSAESTLTTQGGSRSHGGAFTKEIFNSYPERQQRYDLNNVQDVSPDLEPQSRNKKVATSIHRFSVDHFHPHQYSPETLHISKETQSSTSNPKHVTIDFRTLLASEVSTASPATGEATSSISADKPHIASRNITEGNNDGTQRQSQQEQNPTIKFIHLDELGKSFDGNSLQDISSEQLRRPHVYLDGEDSLYHDAHDPKKSMHDIHSSEATSAEVAPLVHDLLLPHHQDRGDHSSAPLKHAPQTSSETGDHNRTAYTHEERPGRHQSRESDLEENYNKSRKQDVPVMKTTWEIDVSELQSPGRKKKKVPTATLR